MNTEETTNLENSDDQISQGENQLSQEIERSEGDPSWGEVQDEETETQNSIDNEISTQEETQEEPEFETEEDEQKNTPQDDSRRVLSFSDYFNRQN
jgi:hypothetical protein